MRFLAVTSCLLAACAQMPPSLPSNPCIVTHHHRRAPTTYTVAGDQVGSITPVLRDSFHARGDLIQEQNYRELGLTSIIIGLAGGVAGGLALAEDEHPNRERVGAGLIGTGVAFAVVGAALQIAGAAHHRRAIDRYNIAAEREGSCPPQD